LRCRHRAGAERRMTVRPARGSAPDGCTLRRDGAACAELINHDV